MPPFTFAPITVPPRPAIPGLQETLASQFARARQNILGTVPRGGGLFSALAGLESERAQAVTGLASQREQQAFQDQLLQSQFNEQAARLSAGFNLQNQQLVNEQSRAALQAELTRAQLAMQRQAQTNQALGGLGLGLLGVGGQLLPRLLFPSQFPGGSPGGGGGIGPGTILQQFRSPLLDALVGNTGGVGAAGGSLGPAGSFGDPISFLQPALGEGIGAGSFDLPPAFGGALGTGGTGLGTAAATGAFDLPTAFGGALGTGGIESAAGAGAGLGAAALAFAPLAAIGPFFGGHLHGGGLGPPTVKAQSWINQQLATGLNLDQAVENLIKQHNEWNTSSVDALNKLTGSDLPPLRSGAEDAPFADWIQGGLGPQYPSGGMGITQALISRLLEGPYGRPDLAQKFTSAVSENETKYQAALDRLKGIAGQGGPTGLGQFGLPALTERGH